MRTTTTITKSSGTGYSAAFPLSDLGGLAGKVVRIAGVLDGTLNDAQNIDVLMACGSETDPSAWTVLDAIVNEPGVDISGSSFDINLLADGEDGPAELHPGQPVYIAIKVNTAGGGGASTSLEVAVTISDARIPD